MKNKIRWLAAVCLVSAILLCLCPGIACSPSPEEAVSSPIEITDQLGRVVRLEALPKRIISLSPGNTEILFALGLDDRLVAVTDYCNYPPEAEEKASIGGYSTPNIEEIIALSPDLILATSIHEKRIIPQLEEKGLPVLALNPRTLDEVLAAITLAGEVAGKEAEAAALVAEMRGRIKAVTDRTDGLPREQRPRVFFVTWHDPLMTPGSETRHAELIRLAGGINIGQELTGYSEISLEAVISANPEVIIAGVGMGTGKDQTLQFVYTESRLSDTDALRNNRVYAVYTDLAGRPGPRIIDALEQFAQFIHPELF